MQQSYRRMQLGQNPLIITVRDCIRRRRGQLQVGRRISVFVKLWVFEILPNEPAIFDRKLVLFVVQVRFHALLKQSFDFSKGHVCQGNHTRAG